MLGKDIGQRNTEELISRSRCLTSPSLFNFTTGHTYRTPWWLPELRGYIWREGTVMGRISGRVLLPLLQVYCQDGKRAIGSPASEGY
jgi:hypothetical protein